MTSVYQVFETSAERFGDKPFLHIPAIAASTYSKGDIDLSYAQAVEAVNALYPRYKAAGYGSGQRVALLLENTAAFFLHWFALNRLGVSVVPVNSELTSAEMAYQLNHSEACLVVTVAPKLADLKTAIKAANREIAWVCIDHMDNLAPAANTASQQALAQADDECALLYTSGSTGKPKGCVLSNDYFLTCGRWYRGLGGLCTLEEGRERLITPLPLLHMNAMACSSMAMIMTGGCIIQLDRFHPRHWWQTVVDSHASIAHYLGIMPAILLNMPISALDRAHHLKFGFGAGVNPQHHLPFEQRFQFPLIEAWAMTESGCGGAIIANREPRHVGTSCFGKASDNIAYKVVDEQGGDVGKGNRGELLVRAAGNNPRKGFFTEYLKDPQATAKAWEGGWLHTGDIVREGEDAQLHFVDRSKNIIRRSGENISALEVEATLSQHPWVEQVAVAPVVDELRGDEVIACIVLNSAQQSNAASAQAIFQHSVQNLVYFKAPGYIAFVKQLPLTASQKPQRGELKILCANLVEKIGAGETPCFDLRQLKKRPRQDVSA